MAEGHLIRDPAYLSPISVTVTVIYRNGSHFLLAKNDDRQRLLRKLFGTRTYEDYQTVLEQRRKDAERALASAGDGVVILLGEADHLIAAPADPDAAPEDDPGAEDTSPEEGD